MSADTKQKVFLAVIGGLIAVATGILIPYVSNLVSQEFKTRDIQTLNVDEVVALVMKLNNNSSGIGKGEGIDHYQMGFIVENCDNSDIFDSTITVTTVGQKPPPLPITLHISRSVSDLQGVYYLPFPSKDYPNLAFTIEVYRDGPNAIIALKNSTDHGPGQTGQMTPPLVRAK